MKEAQVKSLSTMLQHFTDIKPTYNPSNARLNIERVNGYSDKLLLAGNSSTEVLEFLWRKLNKGSITLITGRKHRIILTAENHNGSMYLDLKVKIEREACVFVVESILNTKNKVQKTHQGGFDYAVLETLRSADLFSIRTLLESFNEAGRPAFKN